jgi:putative salt-induced outer membrane protein
VASSSFEAGTKSDATANDTTEAKLSFGAVANTGNSRSLASTGTGTFRLRRGKNQLSVAAAANYAKSRPADETRMQTTVENYQGKARYDRFVASHFALFGAISLRKDKFQGLDVRLNLDPGIAYYFIDAKLTQFWSELGYDYQYDLRTLDAVRTANATITESDDRLTRKQDRHSGRLFLGYATAFNDKVAFTSGLEYLQALAATENWRLLADAGINATLAGKLSIATTLTVRYDHNPLPKIEKVDTMESVSLVYTLL